MATTATEQASDARLRAALDDERRLAALHRLRLLDSPADAAFDRLAKLAARTLDTPVALVTLVDRDRQFFKSCLGLPPPWSQWRETPLSHSFCQHVVAACEPLVVSDARRHPIFKDNPAIEDLGVVAYLGSPLVLPDGEVIGSFCVIDSRPREWRDEDVSVVRELAALVMTEVDLRATRERLDDIVANQRGELAAATARLRESEARYRATFDHAAVGISHVTPEGRYLRMNEKLCEILGYSRDELLQLSFQQITHPEDLADDLERARRLLVGEYPAYTMEKRYLRKDGSVVWANLTVSLVHDARGEPEYLIGVIENITARKLAERELQVKEQALATSVTPIAFGNLDGSITYANRAFLSLWGYDDEREVLGRSNREFGADPARVTEIMRALIEHGSWTGEDMARRRDGGTFPVQLTASLVRDTEGRPFCTMATFIDISERKRAEAQVTRLGYLLDASANEVYVVDAQSRRILYANQAVIQALGYTREELAAMTPVDIVPDMSAAQLRALLAPLFKGQRLVLYEGELRRKDGRRYPIQARLQLIEEQGRALILAIVIDITQRKRVDEVINMLARGSGELPFDEFLRASVRQLATIYDARYAFVGRIAEPARRQIQTQAVWAGGRLAENFLYDLEGTPCADILDFSAELIASDAWRRYPKDVLLKEMGVESYFGKPMVSSEGRLLGLVTVMDVRPMVIEPWVEPVLGVFATRLANEFERQQRLSERERMLAELTARNVEMENFVYTISHDLKTPLITIGGFAGLLARDLERGELAAARDALQEIDRAVGQMNKHIHDLLLLSRTGRVAGDRTVVALADLIARALDGLRPRIAEAGATVTLAPHLPEITVDREGFARAFNNLLDNALKYRREEAALRIEIGAERVGEELRIYVRDNGGGIKLEYQERIFGLFERADSRTEGTGVGLAIVRRVVEVHGGRIWVESEPGVGSTFWIALPGQGA